MAAFGVVLSDAVDAVTYCRPGTACAGDATANEEAAATTTAASHAALLLMARERIDARQ